MGLCWKHPSSAILTWPSNCGKVYFVKGLLENANHYLSVMPENNKWSDCCWQELFCKYSFIKFVEDASESRSHSHLFPSNKVNMVVINDLMNSACESNKTDKAFTKYVQKELHSHSQHKIYGVIREYQRQPPGCVPSQADVSCKTLFFLGPLKDVPKYHMGI